MRLFRVVTLLAGCLIAVSVRAQLITAVDPLSAKAGDTVSAKGEGIDNAAVDTLLLDGWHQRFQERDDRAYRDEHHF